MAEHKIYRSLERGPLMWGLPVVQAGLTLGSASLGFFIIKSLLGLWGAGFWIALHGCIWAVLAFLTAQDPMYLPMLMLKRAGKFYPKLTCYEPVQKRVTWTNE